MESINVLRNQHWFDFIVCETELLELSDGLMNDIWFALTYVLDEIIMPIPYFFWLLLEIAFC